jgi:hypothetical protein
MGGVGRGVDGGLELSIARVNWHQVSLVDRCILKARRGKVFVLEFSTEAVRYGCVFRSSVVYVFGGSQAGVESALCRHPDLGESRIVSSRRPGQVQACDPCRLSGRQEWMNLRATVFQVSRSNGAIELRQKSCGKCGKLKQWTGAAESINGLGPCLWLSTSLDSLSMSP